MNNAVRLFSIIIFIFLIPTCLANAIEDEERELNLTLLRPIIDHFSDSNSYTRLISRKIIEWEITNKTQLNKLGAINLKKQILKEPPFNDENIQCIGLTIHKIKAQTAVETLATRNLNIWLMKSVTCGDYAELVLIALALHLI